MCGNDADEGPGRDRSWINIRPGIAVEITYSSTEYSMSFDDQEVDAKLTGRVRITHDQIFAADFLVNSITGKEE